MSSDKSPLDELRIDRSVQAKPSSRSWTVAGLVILVMVGGGLAWWFNQPKVMEVQTFTVRETSPEGQKAVLNASGYVTARRQATVSSKVTGKVVEVCLEEGMRVEEGQVLARLDATNIMVSFKLAEAQRSSATAALAETKARLKVAELEFKRTADLAKDKVASQSDFDRAKADAEALQAHLEQQQAEVEVADRQVAVWRQQLDDMIIRAPFSGIVVTKNAQPGEMISPVSAGGGFTRTGIGTIVDMNSLEIEVDVNESYINRVKPGQAVAATLDSYPDWKIPTKVIAIIPTADRQKATVKVRIGFDALDNRILPDMGVKVAFQGTASATSVGSQSMVIPQAAIRRQEGKDTVLVLKDGRVNRRPVTLGNTRNEEIQVVAGLNPGEKVVIKGPEDLADGARVRETK